jgi:hypothetical protein
MEHDIIAGAPHRQPEHKGHAGRPRHRHAVWMDWIVTSDLGLGRLRLAVQTGLTLGLVMLSEWFLIHYTHALQVQVSLPPHGAVLPQAMAAKVAAVAATVALQHHAAIVAAMLFGCYVTVVAAGGIPGENVRGQVIGLAAMAPPLVGGLAFALKADGNRTLSLTLLVVLIGVGTYAWRWGALGFIFGSMVLSGFFMGYLLRTVLTESDLGWATAEIGIGLGACLLVRLTLFYLSRIRALRRFERSFLGCARLVADLIAEVVHTRGTVPARTRRRLDRLLLRLNEAALLLDARLAAIPGGRGVAAAQLHEALFDAELALGDIARAVVSLDRASLPPGVHLQIGRAVAALRAGDMGTARTEGERLRQAGDELLALAPARTGDRIQWTGSSLVRLSIAVQTLAAALPRRRGAWTSVERETEAQPLSSSVRLAGGWLQGSAMVSAVASARPPRRGPGMHPALRLAIQATVSSPGGCWRTSSASVTAGRSPSS